MGEQRFKFGENWQSYLDKYFSEERVKIAKQSLQSAFGLDRFEGKSFLDIGCGSGLYSYAASELGASEIVSFDYDEDSVAACRALKEQEDHNINWEVIQGDILDDEFVNELGSYDLVYAWGVLHHTGCLYVAIKETLTLVADEGMLFLAIYNDSCSGRFSSSDWLWIKQIYNSSPWPVKRILELWYVFYWSAIRMKRGQNPIRMIRDYKYEGGHAGMAFYPDVKDWLGGLPYEFATVEDITNFVNETADEFELIHVEDVNGTGNNKFLYRKS